MAEHVEPSFDSRQKKVPKSVFDANSRLNRTCMGKHLRKLSDPVHLRFLAESRPAESEGSTHVESHQGRFTELCSGTDTPVSRPHFLRTPVRSIARGPDSVAVECERGLSHYDEVIFACHSDRALSILGEQASAAEKSVLGAIPYEPNTAVLHTDTSLLPRRRSACPVGITTFRQALLIMRR